MTTLAQALLADDDRRDALIAGCVTLIEQQVAHRGPVRRIALSAGIGVLNAIKPNALRRAVGALLPDFTDALDPLYRQFLQSRRGDFSRFMEENSDAATSALIGVADRRMHASHNAGVRAAYNRLRGSAEGEVRAAIPGLAAILHRHLAPGVAGQRDKNARVKPAA